MAATRSITGLRRDLVTAWSAGSSRRRAALFLGGALAVALGGAFLFGLWHVVFGGLVKGNPRAGAFGLALAAVAALLLAGETAFLRWRFRG